MHDKLWVFCTDNVASAAGAIQDPSNCIDAGAAVNLFGYCKDLCLVLQASAHSGAPTKLVVDLRGADDAALTTNPVTLATATLEGTATKLMGVPVEAKINQTKAKRYYGLWTTITGTSSYTIDCYVAMVTADNMRGSGFADGDKE